MQGPSVLSFPETRNNDGWASVMGRSWPAVEGSPGGKRYRPGLGSGRVKKLLCGSSV